RALYFNDCAPGRSSLRPATITLLFGQIVRLLLSGHLRFRCILASGPCAWISLLFGVWCRHRPRMGFEGSAVQSHCARSAVGIRRGRVGLAVPVVQVVVE